MSEDFYIDLRRQLDAESAVLYPRSLPPAEVSYVPLEEAAALMGLPSSEVRQLAEAGVLESRGVGPNLLLEPAALQ